jgi:hypothetical protein
MKPAQRLTAIIEREDDGFVALCGTLLSIIRQSEIPRSLFETER